MKRFFAVISSLLLCCSFLFTTASAAFVNGGSTTATVYGHTYKYYSSIGKSDSDEVYGVTTVSSSDRIPTGYSGVCARLYTSEGVLSKSGSWIYNEHEVNAMGSGSLYAPTSGTFYCKGQVRLYNGDGYTTYSTKASPNITQSRTHSMPVSTLQTNQNGLTYGSALFSEKEPDLILAEGISGNVGYVKSSDLNGPMPTSTYAASQMLSSQSRVIPVYSDDGVSVIDTFVVDATTPIYS